MRRVTQPLGVLLYARIGISRQRGPSSHLFRVRPVKVRVSHMEKPVLLRGYHYSVYTRIARMALHEKGVPHDAQEIDPFGADIPADYLRRHPFRRVPVLSHGDFDIYETAAITRYVDDAFAGPPLLPHAAQARARTAQVVSIVDNYAYRPLVRQVFAHRVFAPAIGEQGDATEIAAGLAESGPVLGALNTLAAEGLVLSGDTVTLADCHLAPMIAYFVAAPEGAAALEAYFALAQWWARISERTSLSATDPGLPRGGL